MIANEFLLLQVLGIEEKKGNRQKYEKKKQIGLYLLVLMNKTVVF